MRVHDMPGAPAIAGAPMSAGSSIRMVPFLSEPAATLHSIDALSTLKVYPAKRLPVLIRRLSCRSNEEAALPTEVAGWPVRASPFRPAAGSGPS